MLMKVLWAARNSRFDLLRATTHLACYITKWTPLEDKKLHKLLSYIQTTQHYRLVGWVGDKLEDIQPHLFADADLAGDPLTQRSTSGAHLCLRGPHTSFPIAGLSQRQTCVSRSTPEAEMIALAKALATHGLPGMILWQYLLPHHPTLYFHEDNQPMIRVIQTGKTQQ